MGHYDDAYEYDAERRRERKVFRLKEALDIAKDLKNTLDSEVPERFIHNIEDLINYLKVNT